MRGAVVLISIISACTAWNPDAGLITSYTKLPGVSVTASSNVNDTYLTVDGEDTTHWTSAGCLPTFFLNNPLSNVLRDACQVSGRCTTSNIQAVSEPVSATDGDTYTHTHLKAGSDQSQLSWLDIPLQDPQRLLYISLRGRYDSNITWIELYNGDSLVHTFSENATDNYKTLVLKVHTNSTVSKIRIIFHTELMLWEIGAIGHNGCVDSVTWNLGTIKDIGVVKSRHWAGHHGMKTELVMSTDGLNWFHAADLNAQALSTVTIDLSPSVKAQYVKIVHYYTDTNYAKVYMWEMDVYDQNGEYGPAPQAQPNPTPLRQMLGVNGIWGWGNGRASVTLPAGQGAVLYSPVASHGRNYHNMDWDVTDPDLSSNYSKMAAGRGTQSKYWLNWDTEYAEWLNANLTVHVSLQFTAKMFPPHVWDNVDTSARRYGEEFARHFGKTHGTGAATAAEVGNEPWDYDAQFYHEILLNMAAGLKSGDPNLIVMSGAFQADKKEDINNYIGSRVTEDVSPFIDVINTHHYSFLTLPDGVRITTYPEHPASAFNGLRNIIRWRDANTPSKPVWVTEWGWDCPGAGEDCTFSECVSEEAAATYAVRGLLLQARSGVQRSTWFFYANLNECSDHIFCRSGLRGTKQVSFQEKKPYVALSSLLNILGDAMFLGVLQEDHFAYVYTFGYMDDINGRKIVTHVAAWRPVDTATTTDRVTVSFKLGAQPLEAFCQVDGAFQSCHDILPTLGSESTWSISISASPVIVQAQDLRTDAIIG